MRERPGTASELCSLPKPEEYVSPSAVFLAWSIALIPHSRCPRKPSDPPDDESYAPP